MVNSTVGIGSEESAPEAMKYVAGFFDGWMAGWKDGWDSGRTPVEEEE